MSPLIRENKLRELVRDYGYNYNEMYHIIQNRDVLIGLMDSKQTKIYNKLIDYGII